MQDFGAPVGYRVILQAPAKFRGLIMQNANAYMEGLTEARQAFFLNANKDRAPEGVAKVYDYVSRDAIINRQYLRDVRGKEEIMSPDSWTWGAMRPATSDIGVNSGSAPASLVTVSSVTRKSSYAGHARGPQSEREAICRQS